MDLRTTELPARTKIAGEESGLVIPAGKHLRIETSPDGVEILDYEVPAGGITVTIGVDIDRTIP